MKHTLFKKAFAALVLIAGLGVGSWAAVQQVNDAANASTTKFHVDVTGYAKPDADGNRAAVPVSADVFGDYHFVVTMPDKDNSTVGADKATVNVKMTGVKSLGMKDDETRSYSKTVETGVKNPTTGQIIYQPLTTFLSNVYSFEGATIPVTIKDGTKPGVQFDYQIGSFANNQIVGTPSDEAKAREAWHLITNNVSASQDLKDNDTHFLFKRGAYILIGDEKLVFDQDYDFLKGNADLKTLFSDVRPYVHVEKSGLTGQAANKAVVYLPEGSTLGISSSAAVLNKDAFLTVDATDKEVDPELTTGVFTNLREQLSKSGDDATKVAIAFAVSSVNNIVGMVNKQTVPVTLEFKKNKFHVDVTGYSSDKEDAVPVTVNADVYSDYSFDVSLPVAGSDQLTASKATVNLRMSDVASLGVKGTRSYSKTVETGVGGVTATLSGALENTYKFEGASCPVTIKADGQEKSFTYNIAGIKDNHIVGTPDNSANAQAAWQLMTSKVSAAQGSTDDTHFLFKKGAYLQVGDERLVFLKDFDFLKGSASMANLFDGAQTRIEKANVKGGKTLKGVIYLPAGSTLGVSQSNATVTEDVKVTMSAFDELAQQVEDDDGLTGIITTIKSSTSNLDAKTAIGGLIQIFDAIVSMVDETDGVNFTVEFTKPAGTPKFHLDVTGYDADTDAPIAVNADVYGDYSFKVALPDAYNDNLTASKATVNIVMTGVESLGLKAGETRNYSKTLETGVTGVSAKLSEYLKNTYVFNGVKAPVTIKDGTGSKSFTYNIAGINEDFQIVGTPSSTEDARAAWKLMTSHVKASQDLSTNDTHFLFKKGAYVQLGDEKLVFDTDFDFLKGSANLDDLFNDIRPAVHVEKANLTGSAVKTASVYLPAGSTLGVSSSNATVDQDVTVTMDASQSTVDESKFKGLLSGYRDKIYANGKANKQTAIALLVYYFDQVVGLADNAEEVPFTVEFTKPETPKFHLDVTGYSSDAADASEVPVDADVYGDYHFVVSLPAPGLDKLTASKATVNISMTGVQTLGLKEGETRSYSKTLETGVAGVSASLSEFLKNTYSFNGVECPVTIEDSKDTKSFTYSIAGTNGNYQIVGTPSSTEDARAAWHLMTSHVKASQNLSTNDTHFLFKKGAYLQLGDEKLVFDTDFDFLKGSANLDDLFNDIRPAVHVEKDDLTGSALKTASVYLPAGSTLGVSSSNATVDENVTVTMNASQSTVDESKFKGLLSGYRDKIYANGSANKKVAIAMLVEYFDQVVGLVDGAEKVPFTVEFTNDGDVQYKNVSTDEWKPKYPETDGYYNIDGDNLYAFRVNNDVAGANVNFTRKFTEGVWAAWVAPFDMEVTDELLQNYEFGYLEGVSNNGKDIDKNSVDGLYIGVKLLKAGQTIKANLPYVVLPKVTETKTFSLENVTLKKTVPQVTSLTGHAYKYNLNGIFETKKSAEGEIWFAVNKDGNFQKASSNATLKPFRFFLTITDNDNNPYAAKPTLIRLQIIDTPTGINGIENDANGEQKIYDLQGRRVYNPTVKGVYIVNGHKVILGK